MRRISSLVATAGLLVVLTVSPVRGSEPASHDVTAPAGAGKTVHVEWTGNIPPGANTGSSCVNAPATDPHTINLAVPAGLYQGLIVRATFLITWSGPTDGIITVMTPSGSAVSGDNGFVDADEFVNLVNPPAGTYQVHACAFAGAAPQAYTGSLHLVAAVPGVCGSDVVDGVDLQKATISEVQSSLASGRTTSRSLVGAYLAHRDVRPKRTEAELDPRAEPKRTCRSRRL